MTRKNIFSQMFDLRPCTKRGDLDLAQVKKIQEILDLRYKYKKKNQFFVKRDSSQKKKRTSLKRKTHKNNKTLYWEEILKIIPEVQISFDEPVETKIAETLILENSSPSRETVLAELEEFLAETGEVFQDSIEESPAEKILETDEVAVRQEIGSSLQLSESVWQPFHFETKTLPRDNFRRLILNFAGVGLMIFLVMGGLALAGQGFSAKKNILSSALQAYQAMLQAKDSASQRDFSSAQVDFETASQNFLQAQEELNKMGRALIFVLEKLPGGSIISSAESLVQAGEDLAQAGSSFAQIGSLLMGDKAGDYFSSGRSLTQKIIEAKTEIKTAQLSLVRASQDLAKVALADLPAEVVSSVGSLKEKLPIVSQAVNQINFWSDIFLEFLGQQKPKKYLLIFQNNSEARPTGGFIGTYGILDLDRGQIKNLFIDGIFNLDGQLLEKVVPPKPIQKISTAWSTHDANWFADFPTSAKKILWFYEKAGGATADGVISLTPTVIERLLAITGPIELAEYNLSLNQDNFLETTQYKVEVDYDKNLNQPKKILADFAPKFLDKLWEVWPANSGEILSVFNQALSEKHILFYFSDETLQKAFSEQGWAGQILETSKDYLSVVNTNINGYKTDRVVEQQIFHESQVQSDGQIIDTVRIVRHHLGGKSQFEWYNKVNADYLRVYLPLGSKLLSAQGQTLEANQAPIDYEVQGFRTDSDVQAQEQSLRIDPNSGTQIFEESGKTVFANWIYVSPGETVEIIYQYLLPFKINLQNKDATWSLLVQKQLGSLSSAFESKLILPAAYPISWQYPANLEISGNQIRFSEELKTDKFFGIVFSPGG